MKEGLITLGGLSHPSAACLKKLKERAELDWGADDLRTPL
jgi:hypothetical protein